MSVTITDQRKAEYAAKIFNESERSKTTARERHYSALGRTDFPVFNNKGEVVKTSSEILRYFRTIYQIVQRCFGESEVFPGILRPKTPGFSSPNYRTTSRGRGRAL